MDSLMLSKKRSTAKCFPTPLTSIWFYSSVNSLMLNKEGTATKGFPTFLTCIGSLSSMSPLMLGKGWALSKRFSTFTTFPRLFLCRESWAFTLVWNLISVYAACLPLMQALFCRDPEMCNKAGGQEQASLKIIFLANCFRRSFLVDKSYFPKTSFLKKAWSTNLSSRVFLHALTCIFFFKYRILVCILWWRICYYPWWISFRDILLWNRLVH